MTRKFIDDWILDDATGDWVKVVRKLEVQN